MTGLKKSFDSAAQIVIVEDWIEELKRLVPTR
jgi:hypothetical protein